MATQTVYTAVRFAAISLTTAALDVPSSDSSVGLGGRIGEGCIKFTLSPTLHKILPFWIPTPSRRLPKQAQANQIIVVDICAAVLIAKLRYTERAGKLSAASASNFLLASVYRGHSFKITVELSARSKSA